MAYTYDPVFAADPSNAANVAANASIILFDPADSGMAPIAITDVTGSPLSNPITVNKNGFGPAFVATIDRVGWNGAGFTGYFTSYEGMKTVATDAADAAALAQSAAETAGADAAAVAEAALAGAVADAEAAQAAATAAAGLVGAPADAAVEALINTPASATATALAATYAPTEGSLNYASPSYVTPRRFPRPQPKKTVSVQTGHGFTIAGTYDGASNLNDTTDFVFGSQSIKVVTDTIASSADVVKTGMALDARAASLRVWLKVTDTTKLGQVIFYAGSNGGLTHHWLWTMAGTIPTPDTRFIRAGEWVGITLPWSDATVTGTPDRAAITNFQIRFRGVSGQQATAHIGGVEVVAADQSFAKGVVSITFDDSKESQYTTARPIMDKYGFPGTAFTIPEAWGTATYMTLAQHKELEDKHGWEIAAHSMSIADHNTNFVGATPTYLDARLAQMRAFLKANGFRGSDVGAYPQGAFSPDVIETVRKYQSAARLAVSTLDFRAETLPPADPMRIRSLQLNNGVTPAAVIAMIDKAVANKEWIVLLVHGVATVGDAGNYPTADFTTVIDYIASSGIACRTMGDVLGAATAPTVPAILPAGEINLAVGLSDVAATIVDSRFGYTITDAAADTGVYYQSVTLPLDAFTGTAIGFDINWASPVAITGTVRWLGRLSVLNASGAVVSTASVDVAITPTVPGVANTTATTRMDFPTVKADGTAKRLELRLTRTATHGGDTSTGDVRLLGAKLVYSKS